MIYAEPVLREIVTRPVNAVVALIELPASVQRSLKQANELMEHSRTQLEAMQRQTDEALGQAERMNELLSRVVRLTDPLEKGLRGSEAVGGALKRAILGEEPERAARAVADAETAAVDAERAAIDAEAAAVEAEKATEPTEER